MMLALAVLGSMSVFAYDSDYEDDETKVRKSIKKKSGKQRDNADYWSDDDYWDEASWEDDEVEPVVKKKKKAKSKKKKSEAEDSWDNWDSWDEDDEIDFFSDDTSKSVKSKVLTDKVQKREPDTRKSERPKPVAEPKPLNPREECVRKLIAGSPDIDYIVLQIVHPDWQNSVRVCKEHAVLVHMNHWRDVATVLKLTERELRVKWDKWGEERFLRQSDNRYMLDSMVKRSVSSLSRKATRAAKRLRSRKAIPWEEYGWIGWIMDYIRGNEPPLIYKTFRLVNENMDCKVRFSEEEKVLVKMDKSHEPAAVLGYTGVKLHVRWESGAVETYRRLEDGSYRKIDDERVARQLLDSNISTREKAEDDWFQIWWRDIMNEEKPLTYVNLELKKDNVEYRSRLSKDNLVLIQLPPHKGWAKVIKFDRRQLIIRWNGVTEELYERDDENVYHFVK